MSPVLPTESIARRGGAGDCDAGFRVGLGLHRVNSTL